MLDTIRFRLTLILALALGSAVIATAGDFRISIQNPSTIKDGSARNAIVREEAMRWLATPVRALDYADAPDVVQNVGSGFLPVY